MTDQGVVKRGMYRKIVVAYDDSGAARDALALASALCAPDGQVLAACSGEPAALPDFAEVTPLPGAPTPAALHDLIETSGADLLVVGPPTTTAAGGAHRSHRSAGLLVNDAPCSVAVASKGFRALPGPSRVVGVALDSSDDAQLALHEGAALARSLGGSVRLLSVKAPLARWAEEAAREVGYDPRGVDRFRRQRRRSLLDRTAQTIADELECEARMLEGQPAQALVAAAKSLDVLVLGSRGHGPARRVALGETSAAVIGEASCPVLVVPRGAGATGGRERDALLQAAVS